jgi:sterol 3beta-glucosyltransferase
MKITILTYGSRGDVQPFIPLSLGLMMRGHSVSLAAPSRFKNFVEDHKIHFVPLAGDPEDLSRQLNDAGYNFLKQFRELMNHAIRIGAEIQRQSEQASKDADLIIHTFAHAVGGHTLAREKNIPDIHIQGFPMFTPTGDYPNVTLPNWQLRAWNRFTHQFAKQMSWWGAKFGYEQVRRQAGLPRRKLYSPSDDDRLRPPTPILCAWSPSVIPPSSDWPPNVHVTGYWFDQEDADFQPDPKLQSFLEAGEPPICVSFGSMLNQDAAKIDHIVRKALRRTGNRGVILSGWSDLKSESSKEFLYLDAVPHTWLLPRCAMVIHHGGAGTTSAGLRAGIPNLVIPHTADQPFWGNRVKDIGAGPKPISVKKLSVENLTRAIVEGNRPAIRKRAQAIGQTLRSEDGVGNSIQWIEKYSNDFLRRNR